MTIKAHLISLEDVLLRWEGVNFFGAGCNAFFDGVDRVCSSSFVVVDTTVDADVAIDVDVEVDVEIKFDWKYLWCRRIGVAGDVAGTLRSVVDKTNGFVTDWFLVETFSIWTTDGMDL